MRALPGLLVLVSLAPLAAQEDPEPIPGVAEFLEGRDLVTREGLLHLHWNPRTERLLLDIPRDGMEVIHATGLASGLGSNPVGLDRGSLGPQHVLAFERHGRRVFAVARNTAYRALSDDARERRAVAESFAPSVLWSFPLKAHTGGRMVVDATGFFLRDAVDVEGRLERAGQEGYRFDTGRSAVHLPRTRSFPDNTEVEVTTTFAAGDAAREVRRTAADGRVLTLRQHHSFVRLPDDGYRPREHDPRVGYSAVAFSDYAAPLGEPMTRRWIARHRLLREDPAADRSAPVEPIVYHLDPGIPEPVLSALREGAGWWAEAFAAAGFEDAFRVELLPPDADPMDVRTHVIHWVHRATRGWSYGASVRDPRTGEILKGNVLLGSLRVRQDHRIFTGLGSDEQGCAAAASPGVDHLVPPGREELARELALARIRQLAAHEVGHTLGLSHNFAASTYGRASVMDYPAPLVTLGEDGEPDFSRAYDTGVGEYDVWAIRWGYSQPGPDQDEEAMLAAILREGLEKGHVFLTDQDARAGSTGHPLAALWDNGSDPVAMLGKVTAVRAHGLEQFGIGRLDEGRPVGALEDVLVPLFLHHRFQLEAALKTIGGVDYRHAVAGDGQPAPRPAAGQERALAAVLETLALRFLNPLTDEQLALPPEPPGHPFRAERFPRSTGPATDRVSMAVVAADMTISGLLQRERTARLVAGVATGPLALDDVVHALVERILALEAEATRPGDEAVARAVLALLIDRMVEAARDRRALPEVRATLVQHLRRLEVALRAMEGTESMRAFRREEALRLRRFLDRPFQEPRPSRTPDAPPGSPIGEGR